MMGQPQEEQKKSTGPNVQSTMEALKNSKGNPEAAAMGMIKDKLKDTLGEGAASTMEAINTGRKVVEYVEMAGAAAAAAPGCCIVFLAGGFIGIVYGLWTDYGISGVLNLIGDSIVDLLCAITGLC